MHRNGNITQMVITEQMAYNLPNPILIFNNGTDYIDMTPGIDLSTATIEPPSSTPPPFPSSGVMYQWSVYQIKNGFRYETSNKSEVKYFLTFYNSSGNALTGTGYDNGFYGPAEIAEITENDINNSTAFSGQTIDVMGVPLGPSNVQGYPYIYITIYEHDWYKLFGGHFTPCTLDVPSVAGNPYPPFDHKLKMKYAHEWYYRDYCRIDHWATLGGFSIFNLGGVKGFFTIHRTQ